MTISLERLDFLHRENELRQEDVRRLRSSVERKIALLKSQFSQTKRRHAHFKSTFLEDRFSMAPKKFFDSLSAIRKNQHGEQALQKNLEVITKHSHRLERQLAYYEKKQELVAKKQAEQRAVERAIKEECESEQTQNLAFLVRHATQEANRLRCQHEPASDVSSVAHEHLSAEEDEAVTLGKKVSVELNEREEEIAQAILTSECISPDEVLLAEDVSSQLFSGCDERNTSPGSSFPFQESMNQRQHDHCPLSQDNDRVPDSDMTRRLSSDGSPQKAQHWEDRDGHHHLIFQVSLSRHERVRVAVERQRENHLSLILIADRGQRISLEQVRINLYNRLQSSGFVLDQLRIIREG